MNYLFINKFYNLSLSVLTLIKKEVNFNKMPRGDRTGPDGMGPMTGRGLGLCSGYNTPGFTKGRGRGRGRGRRYNFISSNFNNYSPKQELNYLKKEKESIDKRIGELEKIVEE